MHSLSSRWHCYLEGYLLHQQQQYATPQQIVSQQLQQPPQQQPTIISKAPMIYDDKIALGFIKPWEHAVIKSNIYDKGW